MCTLAPNYSNLHFIFNKARESANNQSLLEKKGVATSTQPTPQPHWQPFTHPPFFILDLFEKCQTDHIICHNIEGGKWQFIYIL